MIRRLLDAIGLVTRADADRELGDAVRSFEASLVSARAADQRRIADLEAEVVFLKLFGAERDDGEGPPFGRAWPRSASVSLRIVDENLASPYGEGVLGGRRGFDGSNCPGVPPITAETVLDVRLQDDLPPLGTSEGNTFDNSFMGMRLVPNSGLVDEAIIISYDRKPPWRVPTHALKIKL